MTNTLPRLARTSDASFRRGIVLAVMSKMASSPRTGRGFRHTPLTTNIAYECFRVMRGTVENADTLPYDTLRATVLEAYMMDKPIILDSNFGFADGTQFAYGLQDFTGTIRSDLKALEALGLVSLSGIEWTVTTAGDAYVPVYLTPEEARRRIDAFRAERTARGQQTGHVDIDAKGNAYESLSWERMMSE